MTFKTCTALVTPFDEDYKIDYNSLKNLIEYQIANKIDAILILGTTGESPTISTVEREQIIKFCVKQINKRCLLLVGTGSNNTQHAIENTKQAKTLGADAAVIVTPYYNKCTQQGVIEHYALINKTAKFPFIVYNVPSRTGFNILPETLLQLEKLKYMIGTKEASGDINQILSVLNTHTKPVYSGNDKFNYLFFSHGGNGCISVTSNAFPNLVVNQFKSLQNCFDMHKKLFNIISLLFCQVNPIPIKFVLSKMKLSKNILRLPLTKLDKKYIKPLQYEYEKLKNN